MKATDGVAHRPREFPLDEVDGQAGGDELRLLVDLHEEAALIDQDSWFDDQHPGERGFCE